MHFQHSDEIWHDFPELVPGVVSAEGIMPDVAVSDRAAKFSAIASARLARGTESELPEIRAWRRAFARALRVRADLRRWAQLARW